MSKDCDNKNPLHRSGVNQYQRVLKALLPDFVKVDEKESADLILFAKNFASYLKYYNEKNQEDGNWKPFVTIDLSVTLATLIRLDVREFYTYTKDIFDRILATGTSQEADLKKYFKTLFDLGFSITKLIDDYYRTIPADFEFHDVIRNIVNSSLPEYYKRLQKYYSLAKNDNIIDPNSRFAFNDKPDDLIFAQDFNGQVLSDIWKNSSTQDVAFNGSNIPLKIKNTATHNLFTAIFDAYLKALSEIVKSAHTYFDQTISDFPTHSPHYALFITFVKLFKFARNHLNTFTARHLNLYYKEILRLEKQDAQPDNVHLIFELAKTAGNSYLLEKGTVFKAGKDKDKKEIFYDLKDDVVLGKGKVASLKNLFLNINNDGTQQLFASPVANSADGNGASLNTPDKSWQPFGDTTRDVGEVGFAIASDYLFLQEGYRYITFKFYVPDADSIDLKEGDIKNVFTLKLSGEKGWFDVQNLKVNINKNGAYFSLTASLNAGDPSIVPYSQKIHGYHFGRQQPMALFHLKDGKADKKLWDFKFNKIDIDLNVYGIKNLDIENDNGVLNSSKPFDLFGSAPYAGSTFIVGCKELFMKTFQPSDKTGQSFAKISKLSDKGIKRLTMIPQQLDNVTVHLFLKWDNYPDLQKKFYMVNKTTVGVEYLNNSNFKLLDSKKELFNESNPNQYHVTSKSQNAPPLMDVQRYRIIEPPKISEITFELPKQDVNMDMDFTANKNYTTKSKWGFFRLVSNSDFGQAAYIEGMKSAAQKVTITTKNGGSGNQQTTNATISLDNPPPEPYTPVVKEVSLTYLASTTLDFSSNKNDAILHITPFGFKDVSAENKPTTLLPEFENEGELFIGFENLQTDQTLPVLFQVTEGSANPLAQKEPVQWYYLGKNNDWKTFGKEAIADSTNGLIKSGIITFSIPENAVAQNTLMGEQLYWLRATVKTQTSAICKLIEVVAQAAVAQFFDYKQTGNFYKQTLPANTISKMVFPKAAVKKIKQPYASFGGRTKENDSSFFRRVSERLRHKSRAVTMWDYERLVLQEFPEIYKVKCINHTQIIERHSSGTVTYADNELKPGYSLVVPVPSLHNKNAFDPLRPNTSLGVLDDIKQYLMGKISPHVNLDVRNPRFEEIQLAFNVQYVTDDNTLYTKRLKRDIERFMAPWAFDPNTDIEFGGKISKSSLVNFIEERPYVNYISCVKMNQIVNHKIIKSNIEEAVATTSRSVFVSVKSGDKEHGHKINQGDCEC